MFTLATQRFPYSSLISKSTLAFSISKWKEELTDPSPQKRQKRTSKNLPKSFKFERQLFGYPPDFKEPFITNQT